MEIQNLSHDDTIRLTRQAGLLITEWCHSKILEISGSHLQLKDDCTFWATSYLTVPVVEHKRPGLIMPPQRSRKPNNGEKEQHHWKDRFKIYQDTLFSKRWILRLLEVTIFKYTFSNHNFSWTSTDADSVEFSRIDISIVVKFCWTEDAHARGLILASWNLRVLNVVTSKFMLQSSSNLMQRLVKSLQTSSEIFIFEIWYLSSSGYNEWLKP